MFHFKQFSIDQTGCAMKINTDGVLLGAIAESEQPASILDIGAGTGVIALMLAQKYVEARVDAVEVDIDAADTAGRNFNNSPFVHRLQLFTMGFEEYFDKHPNEKYDLIVSNPPFYVDSLKSPGVKKSLAKHADNDFFERLIRNVAMHLSVSGVCWLVLPVSLADLVVDYASDSRLFPRNMISVRSYPESAPHRVILSFSANKDLTINSEIIIYAAKGVYSKEYKKLLQPYFLAF